MAINRVVARWQGFPGGPGYSNFFFTELPSSEGVLAARQAVGDFFDGFSSLLPSGVEIVVENEVAVIDELTGQTLDYAPTTAVVDSVVGSASGGYAGASGAVVNWNTAGVRGGRRVRGRTFLVPLAQLAFDSSGTLSTSGLNLIRSAAADLVGTGFDSGLGVWARPTNGAGGEFHEVIGATVPDLAAVLRSRRD